VVIGRSDGSAAGFAERLQAVGLPATPSAGAPEPQPGDIWCTCTTSSVPVLTRDQLALGAHVNAIGAYRPDTREIDTATVATARVFVESVTSAMTEAGDLLIPIAEGAWSAERLAGTLHDVVSGHAGRCAADEITLYKGVGLAYEDLVVAAAAVGEAS
jgi:ornithine cyclodeaminase/alanine dehydrogenase-like protein (mu-crystallin family)